MQSAVGRDEPEGVEDGIDRHRRVELRRTRLAEQPRHELRAIGGELEQRLVEQLLLEIAAPDVEDDRHRRTQLGDVGEILLGADAEVDGSRPDRPLELRHDELEGPFIRQEVLEAEIAARLREISAEHPELGIGQPVGQPLRRGGRDCGGRLGESSPRRCRYADGRACSGTERNDGTTQMPRHDATSRKSNRSPASQRPGGRAMDLYRRMAE
jgi:hypothetical protein